MNKIKLNTMLSTTTKRPECKLSSTRCSAIAERPRCRVRYSFRQK